MRRLGEPLAFVAAQLPFVDLRPFVPGHTNRLSVPGYPSPDTAKEFVRSFGPMRERVRGGAADWPAEEYFCGAWRGIRFAPSFGAAVELQPSGMSLHQACAFRRVLGTGQAALRVEIGLRFARKVPGLTPSLGAADLLSLVYHALCTPVRVHAARDAHSRQLILSAEKIAAAYLRATTRRENGVTPSMMDWWIAPGTPLVLVDYNTHAANWNTPTYAVRVDTPAYAQVVLSHCLVRHAGRDVGVWLVGTSSQSDQDYLRRLRLQLFRLHAEQQVIGRLLRAIATGLLEVPERSPSSSAIQSFLNRSEALLLGSDRHGVPQSEILKSALWYYESARPGKRETLLQTLAHIRGNVLSKVDSYAKHADEHGLIQREWQTLVINNFGPGVGMQNNSTQSMQINAGGNVSHINQAAADTIMNSFNRVESSGVSDELKARLRELSESVQRMLPHVAPERQEELARDYDALVAEATSDSPRRRWYELSAEGLIEAAKAVGQIAEPVVRSARAVLALLGG